MTAFGMLKWGFLFFTLLGLLAVGIPLLLGRKIGWLGKFFLIGMAAGAFFFIDIFWIEPNWIAVEKVTIRDPGLARVMAGIRAVHLTDIHLTDGLGAREDQLIRKVNRLNPDIIFFTGDIIDNLAQVEPANELFKQLKAKIGIYAVPGNTDHIVMDSGSLRRVLAPAGVDVLINESRRIPLPNGQALWLVGLDDPKYNHDNLQAALGQVPRGVPVLMLAHEPDIIREAQFANVNLILAGDTHGGQVGIDFLIRMSDYANRTPYMRGLFRQGNTQLYVNRGIGTKTLPIRFLCRPEIAVLEFK